MKDVLGLQSFCSLSDDGLPGLCLRTQHGVDVGLCSELEKFLPSLGEPVVVSLEEGRPVVVALRHYVVHLFVLYPQDTRVVSRHHVAVISYIPPVRVLLVPQTYVSRVLTNFLFHKVLVCRLALTSSFISPVM